MAGRYQRLDGDEERLPHGMRRVGYDADTQVYTYQDADGSLWQGGAGNAYGSLTRTSGPVRRIHVDENVIREQNRLAWRYLLPFFLVVAVFLFGIWYVINPAPLNCGSAGKLYRITDGDTCWKIAADAKTTVEGLLGMNPGLDCQRLLPGHQMCVPSLSD